MVVSNIFLFSPLFGEDEPILTHIFQPGLKLNHPTIVTLQLKIPSDFFLDSKLNPELSKKITTHPDIAHPATAIFRQRQP